LYKISLPQFSFPHKAPIWVLIRLPQWTLPPIRNTIVSSASLGLTAADGGAGAVDAYWAPVIAEARSEHKKNTVLAISSGVT
jgi:hypothetical protein